MSNVGLKRIIPVLFVKSRLVKSKLLSDVNVAFNEAVELGLNEIMSKRYHIDKFTYTTVEYTILVLNFRLQFTNFFICISR